MLCVDGLKGKNVAFEHRYELPILTGFDQQWPRLCENALFAAIRGLRFAATCGASDEALC